MLLISSRKKVPPFAISNNPCLMESAPVKAPFSYPKSSLSSRLSGIAAQLRAMKCFFFLGKSPGASPCSAARSGVTVRLWACPCPPTQPENACAAGAEERRPAMSPTTGGKAWRKSLPAFLTTRSLGQNRPGSRSGRCSAASRRRARGETRLES